MAGQPSIFRSDIDSLDVQNLSALSTDLGRTAQGVDTQVVGWLCARCFVHYCIIASVGVGGGGFYNPEIKDQMLINVRDQEFPS